jgi:hypothetical protein
MIGSDLFSQPGILLPALDNYHKSLKSTNSTEDSNMLPPPLVGMIKLNNKSAFFHH